MKKVKKIQNGDTVAQELLSVIDYIDDCPVESAERMKSNIWR
jgi:hypothetical protein